MSNANRSEYTANLYLQGKTPPKLEGQYVKYKQNKRSKLRRAVDAKVDVFRESADNKAAPYIAGVFIVGLLVIVVAKLMGA